jgi:SulP family sulfate permease
LKALFSGLRLNNLFAGFIVAVVALPLCIAFAIASGANPMAGIVSGVVGGLIAALAGSSRYQVSGPAAAFITILYTIIGQHGFTALLAATFVAGLVVLLIAGLRLGRLMELMPHSVIVGFTTGIGVLILLGQVPAALGIDAQGKDALAKLAFTVSHWREGNLAELAVLAVTLFSALLWSRHPLARWVPAPLVALAAGTASALALANAGLPVRTIGALYKISIDGIAWSPDFLAAIPSHLAAVAPAGLTIGILIAVESLLSAKALDAMTGTRHNPDRELFGLGLANLVVPFVGGLPASGVIVRGSTNVMSGGNHHTAAVVHALFLAAFIALLFDGIWLVPLAALAAILILTARRLIEVHELKTIARIDRLEGLLAIATTVLTVTIDLTVSVPVGVALMLVLALRHMLAEKKLDVCDQHGHTVLAVSSTISFLTSGGLMAEMERHLGDARVRTLNLLEAHYIDATGALMLARLLDRHPHLQVWVAQQATSDRLTHAGVPAERITLLGNRVVDLPAVFSRIQRSTTMSARLPAPRFAS